MTDLPDFEDLDTLVKWLKNQPRQLGSALAIRAALRVLPTELTEFHKETGYTGSESRLLELFRVGLTTVGYLSSQTEDTALDIQLQNPLHSASRRTILSEAGGRGAVLSASLAALSTYSNPQEHVENIVKAIVAASVLFNSGGATSSSKPDKAKIQFPPRLLVLEPLWPEDSDACAHYLALWTNFRDAQQGNPIWDFWLRWYQGIWDGKPLDWALARKVALIADEMWEAENAPEAVAAEIRRIEAAWLAERAHVAEITTYSPDSDTFNAHPLEASNTAQLAMVVSRVADALEDLVHLSKGNGMTDASVEALMLRRTCRKYATDPERVVMDFTEARRSLDTQIALYEYPDDPPMQLLKSALTTGVSIVTDMHPEIVVTLQTAYETVPQTPSEPDVLLLTDAMRVSAAISGPDTAHSTEEDAAELLQGEVLDIDSDTPDSPPAQIKPRGSVIRRQIKRLGDMVEKLCRDSVLAEHYDTKTFKSVRVVATYGGLSALFAAAIRVLGQMIGLL